MRETDLIKSLLEVSLVEHENEVELMSFWLPMGCGTNLALCFWDGHASNKEFI